MVKKRHLSPQSVWDADAVAAALEAAGVNAAHHVPRLYTHLVHHPAGSWEDIPDFPRAAVQVLSSQFAVLTSRVLERQRAADGTVKLLVGLADGLQVEAVIMTYDTTGIHGDASGQRRATLCISSEVGCQMGCTFCATGTMGLTADLTAGEIVEQLVHANAHAPVRNVVFMGMGEPLNNYAAVRAAVSLMTDSRGFGLRRKCVTVSTVGVIPRLLQLADDLPGVSLALSLHAPTQELRQLVVPSARAYKLDRLMAAVDAYQGKTGQRVFVEYVMLGPHFNCLPEHARQLGALLASRDVVVNLIPWNPILSPGMAFEAPAAGASAEFQRILREEYGLPSTVRQEKGQDVSAACGQLVLRHGGRQCGGRGGEAGLRDVEDLMGRSAAAAACK